VLAERRRWIGVCPCRAAQDWRDDRFDPGRSTGPGGFTTEESLKRGVSDVETDHGSSITTPAYSLTGPWYTAPTGDLLLVTAGQGADRLAHVVQPDPHALGATIAQQPAELGRVGVERALAVINGDDVRAIHPRRGLGRRLLGRYRLPRPAA